MKITFIRVFQFSRSCRNTQQVGRWGESRVAAGFTDGTRGASGETAASRQFLFPFTGNREGREEEERRRRRREGREGDYTDVGTAYCNIA